MSLVMEDEQIQELTTDFGQSFGRVHSLTQVLTFFGSCRSKHNWILDVALLRMCHVTRHDSSIELEMKIQKSVEIMVNVQGD